MLLPKGFEVEVYTGTPAGDIVGFASQVTAHLSGFVREPDNRNVEYTTPPLLHYERLLVALVEPRQRLRRYLATLGDYTIVPGSTMSLGGSDRFERSDPQNPYHTYIEQTYGTTVVTASIHMNVGISDMELLFRALRVIRMEAALYLALSASSPFLDGRVTGSQSTRWQVFPKTPALVPLFDSHAHYIRWTNEQLQLKTMQNVRHLWAAVRPNGDRRPYSLNRLELRICDLAIDPLALLAIASLLEMRLLSIADDPTLDPLAAGRSPFTPDEAIAIADANEAAAAKDGLDAVLTCWQTGDRRVARAWIADQHQQAQRVARQHGVGCFLDPLRDILERGNEAERWLKAYAAGRSPRDILTDAIREATECETELAEMLAHETALLESVGR